MARTGQRRSSARTRTIDNEGLIPVLARAVREIEQAAQRGKLKPVNRTKFQVVAVLMREERTHAKDPATPLSDPERAETLKRLDGIASILARTAARDTSVLPLLDPDAKLSEAARAMRKHMLFDGGVEMVVEEEPEPEPEDPALAKLHERQVVPPSVKARVLANPFLEPDLDRPAPAAPPTRLLANWELLGPLFKSFEYGAGGGIASMDLPESPRIDRLSPHGLELMRHQARFLESVRLGHREFLLADEPGLGKTAQALLAASVADAYPLLVVVPNVVKMNWKREVERWTPHRRATVIHGDGLGLDAFADVVIVNYEVLDRHIGWLRTLGFRGMVVDEAHFIKNLQSQRSKFVLALAESIRQRQSAPLLMALTGTPLINDIDDFRAIWQFLGWIDGDKPTSRLMGELEEAGLTPADPGFFAEARRAVIDLGIVRRRKVDVATDLPSKRIADLPVELDDDLGRSIRQAERELAARLVKRFTALVGARGTTVPDVMDGPAAERAHLIRLVAQFELDEAKAQKTGENVFTMVRRIGQAKAVLAADYAAQLARSVGKVVFFAKHVDVMDQAEATFAKRELKSVSIRGDQSPAARQNAIDSFQNDPEVKVVVCSLTAAGVGLNLQAASNVVLAELSWTSAEQTQAIDRVHRIGQEEPVTAWRIIAAQTIDAKIAELIDSKAGLAARALDGEDFDEAGSTSVQLDALSHLLEEALAAG